MALLPMAITIKVNLYLALRRVSAFTIRGPLDIREQYMEELNPRVIPKGEYREPVKLLCEKCQASQEQWLARGRDMGFQSALCPECAFEVSEELKVEEEG